MNWQVSDLESSRKLKELGVMQDSIFYWNFTKPGYEDGTTNPYLEFHNKIPQARMGKTYELTSAFTCAELGVALPRTVEGDKFRCFKQSSRWELVYGVEHIVHGETEAQARSKMLIYLLENKLTTVEEVNARLLGVGK